MKAERIKEMGTEKYKETGDENSESVEREVKENNNVDITVRASIATEPEPKPEVELWKSLAKRNCFKRGALIDDLGDECELKIDFVLTEEKSLIQPDLPYSTPCAQD